MAFDLWLCLALVKRLVHEVEGEIHLRSQKNQGTRIRVSIPVLIEGQTQTDLEDDSDNPQNIERNSAPMALLPHSDLELLNLTKLKRLVKLGQLSEVEVWLSRARTLEDLGPESRHLLAKIEAAVKIVDLSEVQALIDEVDTPLSFI